MANTIFFIALGVTAVFFGVMGGMYILLNGSERAYRRRLQGEGQE